MSERLVPRTVEFSRITFGERFRQEYKGIEDLAISIRDKGNLQPIIVDKNLKLLAGGRRYKAIELLEWKEVDVVIRDSDSELDGREIELIENELRERMSWQDKVALTKEIHRLYLLKNEDWTQKETAEVLERSMGGISEHLALAEAMETIPELKNAKTEDDAKKILESLYEKMAIEELEERRGKKNAGKDSKLETLLVEAEDAYRIGDIFDGLATLPDGFEDHGSLISFIEVDPPYAVDLAKKKKPTKGKDQKVHSYNEISAKDYPEFLETLTKELFRVSSPYSRIVFWFGHQWYREVYDALTTAGYLIDVIPAVWSKGHGQTNVVERYLARTYELFFYGRKPTETNAVLKLGRSNLFEFSGVFAGDKYHPTQRPLSLMKEIIDVFGAGLPKDKHRFLVPFLGSGATVIAAKELGYEAFGWDINPEYRDKYLFEVKRIYAKRFIVS